MSRLTSAKGPERLPRRPVAPSSAQAELVRPQRALREALAPARGSPSLRHVLPAHLARATVAVPSHLVRDGHQPVQTCPTAPRPPPGELQVSGRDPSGGVGNGWPGDPGWRWRFSPAPPPHPELQGANSSGHPLVCSTYEVSNEGPGGRHTVLPGVWGCGGSGGGKRGSGRAGTRHQAPVAWLGWQGGVASPAVSAERTFLCSGPSVSPAPWGPPAPTTTGTRTSQDDCAQYPHRHESPKPHAQSPGACPGRSSWPQDRKRGAPSVPMHRRARGPGEAVAGTGQPRRQQGGEW